MERNDTSWLEDIRAYWADLLAREKAQGASQDSGQSDAVSATPVTSGAPAQRRPVQTTPQPYER
jgi:hypothetical protein